MCQKGLEKYFATFFIQPQFYKKHLHEIKCSQVEFLLVLYVLDMTTIDLLSKIETQLRVIPNCFEIFSVIPRTFTVILILSSSGDSNGIEYIIGLGCLH